MYILHLGKEEGTENFSGVLLLSLVFNSKKFLCQSSIFWHILPSLSVLKQSGFFLNSDLYHFLPFIILIDLLNSRIL